MTIDHNLIANEFRQKFKDGNAHLSPPEDIIKYIIALANQVTGHEPENIRRLSQIEFLNTCLNIDILNKVNATINKTDTTIKNLETTITRLNRSNTKLTVFVILLAILTAIICSLQLWLSYSDSKLKSVKPEQHTQLQSQPKKQEIYNEISEQKKTSIFPITSLEEQQSKELSQSQISQKMIPKESSQNNSGNLKYLNQQGTQMNISAKSP